MRVLERPEGIAGVLLLSSIGPLILLIILALRGDLPSIYGLFRPIEELAQKLPLSNWGFLAQLALVILVLAGFVVVTVLLQEAGDGTLGLTALVLLIVAVVLIALEGSFYPSINPWAAREAAKTGTVPELYLALHHWMNKSLQMVYMVFALLAYLGYGWSFLRTGLVPPWGAWAAIVWSLGWLAFTLVAQTTLPVAVFAWPWVVGIMLLI
ncbi:MAG: DUF4386 family protein [Anaerolineales bacterium]|nr:DUF4386 family protein [Anaerolineales bacterium]